MNRKTVAHYMRKFLAMLMALLLLLAPMYLGCIRLFEARQLSQMEVSLVDGLRRFDEQIASLTAIVFSIGETASFRTFALRDVEKLTASDHYRLSQLHRSFTQLCLSQPYVTDYALLFRNHILLTGERTHMADENYYGTYLSFDGMDRDTFWNTFLYLPSTSLFLPEDTVRMVGRNPYQAVTWVSSMSSAYSRHASGVFFATFSNETLSQLFMPGYSQTDCGFTLFSRSGETLLQYGIAQNEHVDGHRLEAVGSQTGLKVSLVLSDKVFVALMAPVQRLLLLSLTAFTLVGMLIALVLAWRTSRPIRQLVGVVHQAGNTAAYGDSARNSFELIEKAIHGLDSSVDEYRSALEAQEDSVRRHVFRTLLRENPIPNSLSTRRHMQEFARCFPDFPKRYRLALLTAYEDDAVAPDEQAEKRVLLAKLIRNGIQPEPSVQFMGKQAVVVLDAQVHTDPIPQLALLKQYALDLWHTPLLIALSDEGCAVEELHRLYEQLGNIVRLIRNTPDNALVDVWQKQNFPDQSETAPMEYSEMDQLYQALKHGEKNAVHSMLSFIANRLKLNTFLDLVMYRQVFYSLRGILLRVKTEHFELLKAVDIPEYNAELSTDQQMERMSECYTQICDMLLPYVSAPQAVFSEAVCRFIDDHLGNSNLSAQMAADHFSISTPTLQKVIRQEKNCSFYEYVEAGRYQRAVRLLTQTDKTVSEIAIECGYNSSNAFHKAFKRISGMNPTAMRQSAGK